MFTSTKGRTEGEVRGEAEQEHDRPVLRSVQQSPEGVGGTQGHRSWNLQEVKGATSCLHVHVCSFWGWGGG